MISMRLVLLLALTSSRTVIYLVEHPHNQTGHHCAANTCAAACSVACERDAGYVRRSAHSAFEGRADKDVREGLFPQSRGQADRSTQRYDCFGTCTARSGCTRHRKATRKRTSASARSGRKKTR